MRSWFNPNRRSVVAGLFAFWAAGGRAAMATVTASEDRWFNSSDGVRLHYLDAGTPRADQSVLVFIPGWTMPAWIWAAQIEHFALDYRVLAFDPRGQGGSAAAASGYNYQRRAADIAQLITNADCRNVVLVGWSLGVLECLQFMHDSGGCKDGAPVIHGLVLVDNSVGEGDPPHGGASTFLPRLRKKRRETVATFVKSMFKREQPKRWLDALTEAALHTPLLASIALLSQDTPRVFWRETLYSLDQPVLYIYTPRFAEQGKLVSAHKSSIETLLFADSGHALFVDDAAGFNAALTSFVNRLPAPVLK